METNNWLSKFQCTFKVSTIKASIPNIIDMIDDIQKAWPPMGYLNGT